MNIIDALKKLEHDIIKATEDALQEISEKLVEEVANTDMIKGNVLKNSAKIIKNGTMARTVLVDKDYAGYVEYGNDQKGPYIYPVNAKALHFYVNGQEVFAKRVRSHPPIPFFKKAVDSVEKEINDIIEKHLSKAIK